MDDIHKYGKSTDNFHQTYQLHISMHGTIAKGTHKLENDHLCQLGLIESALVVWAVTAWSTSKGRLGALKILEELVGMYSMQFWNQIRNMLHIKCKRDNRHHYSIYLMKNNHSVYKESTDTPRHHCRRPGRPWYQNSSCSIV